MGFEDNKDLAGLTSDRVTEQRACILQDREPTSRRLDDLSYLTDMVTSCFAMEEFFFVAKQRIW
jgi:hypothetical protein